MTEKEALKQLEETSEQALLEALEFVREEGTNKLLVKSIQLLAHTENKQVQKKGIQLIEDLKQDEAAEVLAEALDQEEYASIHATLLSACWKNGRNYAAYLPTFIRHFIDQPFEVAFEAFTVIEQQPVSPNQASEALLELKEQQGVITDEKKALYTQLLDLLNSRI
ncbi:MAG: hypothetical protein R6U66_12110 [Bacteroidales bacterium]